MNGFGTNPRAVSQIVSSAAGQAQAANRADMRPAALRGHVSVAQVGTATGAGATRSTPLISLTVTGAKPLNTAAAANALADIVVAKTTAAYVGVKIRTFRATLEERQLAARLDQPPARGARRPRRRRRRTSNPLDQLVIVSQEDNAEARLGNLIAQQETLQQQLAFATQVESAKIIVPARVGEGVGAFAPQLARSSAR